MTTLPDTCKVAALVGINQPMEIMEVPIPKEMEYGSIIVKTTAATICGSDVHYWDGESTTAPTVFPRILGHEMTGRIARLGPGVTHDSVGQPLNEGDRIIWTHGFCGQCQNCTVENQYTLCTNRRGYMSPLCTEYPYLVGGFGEYCYVYPTSGRLKVPDGVSDDLASAAACALRTVVHGFDRLGRIENRQTVAIQGSGPLGLFSLTQALTAGARKVIVIGGPPGRLEIARRWGADYTLDVGELNAQERHERIMDITGGQGPDVVVEVSGAKTAFPEGLQMVRGTGRYLIIGQIGPHEVTFRPADIVRKHMRIISTQSASVAHYWKALQFLQDNAENFTFEDMITSHTPLAGINEAMERMKSFQDLKAALTFPD